MLYIACFITVSGHNIKIFFCPNSIAFGKSTSQRIYPEQHTPKIGWKLHKYGLNML